MDRVDDLLADTVKSVTPGSLFARGLSHIYWGIVRLPGGQDSNAAMFGAHVETPQGERILVCGFGPARYMDDRRTAEASDDGRVEGWSSSSEMGQQVLLEMGAFDAVSETLSDEEKRAAAVAAVKILRGQGTLMTDSVGGTIRKHSGLVGSGLGTWLFRTYIWSTNVQFGDETYDSVGVGAPVWVFLGSDRNPIRFSDPFLQPRGSSPIDVASVATGEGKPHRRLWRGDGQ